MAMIECSLRYGSPALSDPQAEPRRRLSVAGSSSAVHRVGAHRGGLPAIDA